MPRYTSDYRSGSKETYKEFCKEYGLTNLTYKRYLEILYTYNAQFMEEAMLTGNLVPLPYGFGQIGVNRKKTTTLYTDKDGEDHIILPVDWVKSKEKGERVYYYNDHTDGWRCSWIWLKMTTTNMKGKSIWKFTPARTWSRGLAALLKGKNGKDYLYRYTEYDLGRKNKKK